MEPKQIKYRDIGHALLNKTDYILIVWKISTHYYAHPLLFYDIYNIYLCIYIIHHLMYI